MLSLRRPGLTLTLAALLATSLTVVAQPTGARAADALISQGKAATASSSEGDGYSAALAVDGNLTSTRWASQWSDPQWIRIDLGKKCNLSLAVLSWEGAYGKAYEIQVSDNGTDWTTARKVTDSDGGTDDLALTGSGPEDGAGTRTAATAAAHTGHTMAVSTQASGGDADGDSYIPAVPQVTGVTPSTATPPPAYFHESQANCSVTHTTTDDPIVYPGQFGRSHP